MALLHYAEDVAMYPFQVLLTWGCGREPRSDLSSCFPISTIVSPGLAGVHVQPGPRKNSVSIVMLSGVARRPCEALRSRSISTASAVPGVGIHRLRSG